MSVFTFSDVSVVESLISHLENQKNDSATSKTELVEQCMQLLRHSTTYTMIKRRERLELSSTGGRQAIILQGPTGHEQKAALCFPLCTYIDVDVLLAPLLEKLWALGCRTLFSCQGEPGAGLSCTDMAYILFDGSKSFARFLAILEGGECAHLMATASDCVNANHPRDLKTVTTMFERPFIVEAQFKIHVGEPNTPVFRDAKKFPVFAYHVSFAQESIVDMDSAVERFIKRTG
jgi:hypothetical protein